MRIRQYSSILDELGYCPISSTAEDILYSVAKKSIEQLGESASKALLDHICSIDGLSEKELLTNYDLFEKALYRVLKKGAEVILDYLKRELLIQAVLIDTSITISEIRNPRLAIRQIVQRIRAAETLEFVRKIPSCKHITFLYRSDYSKDKLFAAFFDANVIANVSNGLLSFKRPTNDGFRNVNNFMLYEELLHEPRESEVVARRLADWIAKLDSSNESQQQNNTGIATVRIAVEDVVWWVRNGFTGYYLDFEKSMGRYLQGGLSVLCGYNFSNVSNEIIDSKNIKTMIAAHDYVILDESLAVYRSPNVGDKI
jgi:hypothetical protein